MKKLAAIAAAALFAACTQTQSATETATAPDVRLYAMDCGTLSGRDLGPFADDGSYDGQPGSLVVPCFLIRHPSGDLIWDTGFPDAIYDMENHQLPMEQLGTITVAHKLTDQLAQLGLTPADIEFLSVSHSHLDHIGNGGLFAASTWIVDADERAHAFRPEARAAAQQFVNYAALENARTILIEGDGDHDVFGDGSVVIIQTPGHTPGHTVLLVRLPQTGAVLLTGDLWHLAASRPNRRVPRFNFNREQTLASMDKFERIAAETGARVIIQHVPEDIAALPAFPEALR